MERFKRHNYKILSRPYGISFENICLFKSSARKIQNAESLQISLKRNMSISSQLFHHGQQKFSSFMNSHRIALMFFHNSSFLMRVIVMAMSMVVSMRTHLFHLRRSTAAMHRLAAHDLHLHGGVVDVEAVAQRAVHALQDLGTR